MILKYSRLSGLFRRVKDLDVRRLGWLIGGKVKENIESGKFKNGCAIRLSYAFYYAGLRISHADGAVSSGADKRWYLYRVSDIVKFVQKNIGGVSLSGSSALDFKGKKGIIIFSGCHWSDATGHIDLFNGKEVESKKGNDYFAPCNTALLYILK